MAETLEAVAEQALSKLLFALADLEGHGLQTRELSGVRRQMISAIESWARVAPRFDFDVEVRQAVRRLCVRRREEKRRLA